MSGERRKSPGERGWWGRNSGALVLLLPLLVLALAANGQRIADYWFPDEPRIRVLARTDEGPVRLTGTTKDANGKHKVALTVSYVGAETVRSLTPAYAGDEPPPLQIPDSVKVWKIDLRFQASPNTLLSDCRIAVVDAEDHVYRLGVDLLTDTVVPAAGGYPCAPADDPGPQYSFRKEPVKPVEGVDGDSDPRPSSWVYPVYVVMPTDRRPDRVRVWLKLPSYAQFEVRRTAGQAAS